MEPGALAAHLAVLGDAALAVQPEAVLAVTAGGEPGQRLRTLVRPQRVTVRLQLARIAHVARGISVVLARLCTGRLGDGHAEGAGGVLGAGQAGPAQLGRQLADVVDVAGGAGVTGRLTKTGEWGYHRAPSAQHSSHTFCNYTILTITPCLTEGGGVRFTHPPDYLP